MKAMPAEALYWLSDCIGLQLHANKTRVTGTGKLKIPLVNKQRLVCNLAVIASRWFEDYRIATLCVHVRWNLYLYLEINLTTKQAQMFALDAEKIDVSMANMFKSVRNPNTPIERIEKGVVREWGWDKKGSQWTKVDADRVGE